LSQEEIKSILESYITVAVVGLSRDPDKASYQVANYLQSVGYRIFPVNPFADEVLGEKSYKSLLDVPETIEVVDIFRPAEAVPVIVEEAIQLKNRVGSPKVIWMQLGIVNEEAARRARKAGFTVVMDRCMMREHKRLSRKNVLGNNGKHLK
jgi:predicted CoA-binding protein